MPPASVLIGTLRRHLAWLLIAAMVMACVVAGRGLSFTVDPSRSLPLLAGLATLGIAQFIGWRQRRPRLFEGAGAFLQMTLFTVLGVVLSYLIAAADAPLWDDRLAAADRALGIVWPALLAALDRRPVLVALLGVSYHSLVPQMIVAIVALSAQRRFEALRITVLAAIASGLVAILCSAVMPALGLRFDPGAYRHLWPSIAWMQGDLVAGLRDGSHRTFDLTALSGIVTFPSFHAALSVVFIWAWWQLRRGAALLTAWSVLTIAGTPVFGGHYLVDVIAGVLLALPAIALAARTMRAGPARPARPILAPAAAVSRTG